MSASRRLFWDRHCPVLAYVVEKLVWKKPVLGGFD
jgi:hypothetical protein